MPEGSMSAPESQLPPYPNDPSPRAAEQLLREITLLKEIMETKISKVDDRLTHLAEGGQTDYSNQLASLKELLHQQILNVNTRMTETIEARDTKVQAALLALEHSNTLVGASLDKRLDELNRFRAQNKDQEARFALGDVVNQQVKALEEKIQSVQKMVSVNTDRLTRIEAAKAGGNEKVTGIYAFMAFIVTIIVIGTILAANGIFGGR